jgi:hypothetical protein
MKNELLGLAASTKVEDGEQVDLQCQVLRLLLNSKTSSICFPPALGPDYQYQAAANQLCQSLVDENPPDLHTLTIQTLEENNEGRDVAHFLEQMLPVFCNLETLSLENFKCRDADIGLIADHLPQLR